MRKQRRPVVAAQGLQDFQIAACGGVQPQAVVGTLHPQVVEQRQTAALGLLGVGQQRSGCGVRRGQGIGSKAAEMRHLQ
ncbi:hypothetical protein GALL_455550 [mine drainage metagenome]|uniref:Uncharacterized protein n=1 Tax=mine drainage metagenome TaxID=410659 RepID=A0A1J5QA08_9ZZZZ